MKNHIKNSTLDIIGKNLNSPMEAALEVSNTIKTINTASDIMSNSIAALSSVENLIGPLNQIYKTDNFVKITQIPSLYIPRINHLAEAFVGFQDNVNRMFNTMDEICSILAEYNYLLPLTLTFNIYSDLLEFLNKTKNYDNREKEIDKLLLKLFSHNKWEMASDITARLRENNKINPKRIVILEDCIKVLKHNSRKTAANTILPVLIAQIEGIWVDILGVKDKNKLKNTVYDMKNDKYVNPAREILADILFQHTKTELPIKSDFCRNKILHGEEVEYGSINNVIRAFLIIEFLDFIKADDEIKGNDTL
ncbi:hypothetical protein IJ818_00070 [bacterium]|nr:hypothetical protein [bacterium]